LVLLVILISSALLLWQESKLCWYLVNNILTIRRGIMHQYPEARWLEVHSVPEKNMLALTDPEGLFEGAMLVPPVLYFIIEQLDGSRTMPELLQHFIGQGLDLTDEELLLILDQLEEKLCLEGSRVNEARRATRVTYEQKEVRPAAHAGGAYPEQPEELTPFLQSLFTTPNAPVISQLEPKRITGIIAPHIDFRRGNVAYAWAYEPLRYAVNTPTVFIVLGTSHAPLRQRFAISRKAYDTPYGPIQVDMALADALAKQCKQSFFEDESSHRQEHSIEFQAVMLGHTLGASNVTFLPVLCGSVHDLINKDPSQDQALQDFIGATKEALSRDGREVCVIAGVDLAHVGPHFGDKVAPDEPAKVLLEARDRATMQKACAVDAPSFFADVAEAKNDRRICGFAPLYSFLHLMEGSQGTLSYYGQAVTPPDSIVSFASALFTQR
jgi:MEMO1 family protein